jgi:diguanylate cyclase (GGDEF)-like protein
LRQEPAKRPGPPRFSWRLPISVWLVVGFALVIAAIATGSFKALRSTRAATGDVARMQQEFEPLTRTARDLGDGSSRFDNAVLAYLRKDSPENREAVNQSAIELSRSANRWLELEKPGLEDSSNRVVEQILAHQAEGFRLVELRDARRTAGSGLIAAFDRMDRRIEGAGGRGLVVGENLLARPSLAQLARALDSARNDAVSSLDMIQPGRATTEGEEDFERVLSTYADEFAASPGQAWLALMREDFARAVELRRRVVRLDNLIETRRTGFSEGGSTLSQLIRSDVEDPAWARSLLVAERARHAVQNAERTIGDATVKAVILTVLGLLVTGWAVTWPVRRLTAGTRRLGAGELGTRVRRGGAAELDELAQAFNHLAAELDSAEKAVKAYQAQLEQRVEERTLQLQHLADHDPLTNLPNRRQLFQRLESMIREAASASGRVAVVFLDLDNFKTVNDSLGHEFGDSVLMQIGDRLREVAGESGLIARLGGDEFTLVFPLNGAIEQIEARAADLVSSFQRPLRVNQREVAIGVSCGAAVFPDHGRDAAALLRAADTALFRAKELGRNRLCLYDPELLVAASNRFRIEQSLRRAMDGGDFMLHYQPQVCLGRRRATGVEALLRWRQGGNQIVAASEFVAVAEQSGLMLDLSSWVLEQAARDLKDWHARGWMDARVAINVSAQQFMSGDFIGEVERLLARHALAPETIELELTESMLQTGAITIETLRQLRMLGVATALDDFGTGYSSLTSLEQLPLSRVKLDRSVVAEVDWNPRASAIARSIIGLCHNLGLQVTVEGVERPNQLDFLLDCGDVAVQGYLVAYPSDAAEIPGFVEHSTDRIDSLVRAAELSRLEGSDDGGTGTVRRFRRRPG